LNPSQQVSQWRQESELDEKNKKIAELDIKNQSLSLQSENYLRKINELE